LSRVKALMSPWYRLKRYFRSPSLQR